MTQEEEDFQKAHGADWNVAAIAATQVIWAKQKFLGMDKIREAARRDATFRALGYEKTTSAAAFLSRIYEDEGGSSIAEIDALIEEAVKAAKKALQVKRVNAA